MRTYSAEEKEFLKDHSYIEDVIDGHRLRYISSGPEKARTIVFMNGLEIQQMFMRYAQAFEDDRRNKSKIIHSFRMVGELIHEPLIKTSDFDPVRGRILLLQPENDIFSKKDQKTLEELLPEPEVHYMRGSHHGPWVLQEDYILLIRDFLKGLAE